MSLAGSTSRSLLALARVGDPDAWQRLVSLYAPLVLHWCRRRGLDEHDVHDVFQEVFRTVAAGIEKFQRERRGDTFRGWLRTITASRVHDHYRKRQREAQAAGGTEMGARIAAIAAPQAPENDPVPDDRRESALLLRRAMQHIRDQFKPNTWHAFWRTTVDGRPAADVGEELGMSPGAVRVAKSRVLARLREELQA